MTTSPPRRAPMRRRLARLAAVGAVLSALAALAAPGQVAHAAPFVSAAPTQEAPPETAPPALPPAPEPPAPPPSIPPDLPVVEEPPVDPTLPPPPPPPPIPDPSPEVAALLGQLQMLDLQKALAEAQAVLDQAIALEGKVTVIYDAAVADRNAKRKALTDAATTAYVQGGVDAVADRTQYSASDSISVESARMLAGSAIDYTHDQLVRAEAKLSVAASVLKKAQRHTTEATFARDAAQQQIDEANAAIELARKTAATPGADVSPTVLGAPALTADEIVGWYETKGVSGYAAGVDLQTLAASYLFEGASEGVRGDVAFAQAMVETGAFTSPLTRHNNYAGIGACDSCPTGFDFASPQLGVRAQVQLLHAYADKELRILDLANPSVGADPDHLSVRGCCTTWNKLTGTWATDPNYGPKIMTIYLSMLQYAYQQRSAPPPVPPAAPELTPPPAPPS